jgi:junctophilin
MWYNEDEEEEDLLFSPALMARRASESWINTPPIEVMVIGMVLAIKLE